LFQAGLSEFDDRPSKVFLDRIAAFKKNPPPKKWDGVFNLTVK
jgi:adenylate cyclase